MLPKSIFVLVLEKCDPLMRVTSIDYSLREDEGLKRRVLNGI
jgi:hypothetical protein